MGELLSGVVGGGSLDWKYIDASQGTITPAETPETSAVLNWDTTSGTVTQSGGVLTMGAVEVTSASNVYTFGERHRIDFGPAVTPVANVLYGFVDAATTVTAFGDITWSFISQTTNLLQVWENGSAVTGNVAVLGDTVSIEVSDAGIVRYLVNDALVYQSSIVATTDLKVWAGNSGAGSVNAEGTRITQFFAPAGSSVYTAVDGDALMVDTVDPAAINAGFAATDVAWDAAVNITIAQPRVTADAANAGTVASAQFYTVSTTNDISMQVTNVGTYALWGFADIAASATPSSSADIEYLYLCNATSNTAIGYVGGVEVVPSFTYDELTDTLDIVLTKEGTVQFKHNGTVKYTSGVRTVSLRPAFTSNSSARFIESNISGSVEDGKTGYTIALPATVSGKIQTVNFKDYAYDTQSYNMLIDGGANNIIDDTTFTVNTNGANLEFVSPEGTTAWGVNNNE